MEGNGFKELKAWLERNQEQFVFGKYTQEEIAHLAIACGFDRQAIAQWQTSCRFKEAI